MQISALFIQNVCYLEKPGILREFFLAWKFRKSSGNFFFSAKISGNFS